MPDSVRVLCVPGSLRADSLNLALARAAAAMAPDGLEVTVHPLTDVPLYDGDVESAGLPPGASALREAVTAADALLVCAPEYNSSIPGVLKNAIDWLSRPPKPTPLEGLPVALAGASPGGFGTIRSQTHLRQVLQFTGALTLVKPELYVSRATGLFTDGRLTDEKTREQLGDLLGALARWARTVGTARS